ncbi:MAG: LssY C-terminal domain-containing protein [Gammaproteobacteria bacterium]
MIDNARYAVAVVLVVACNAVAQIPDPSAQPTFLERAESQQEAGITISVAVPSADETRTFFGVPLYRRKIQPVWLEIVNDREAPIMFLPVGMDPRYFTSIESAFLGAGGAKKADAAMRKSFLDRKIDMPIQPGERRSGFMFTQLEQGTKSFNVDIRTNDDQIVGFTFFVPVPGLRLDHQDVDWDTLYPADELQDLDRAELIEALRNMPCCTTDKKTKGSGDPLNLVVIGDVDDVYYSFIRAGWDETEVISAASLTKMAGAFVRRSEYKTSPVSGLYVFGRTQDVALQKARDNIDERNHLRLWMSPLRYEGVPVWIGQISRDIGVRLTKKTITTHKIDPDVDETREYLVENLAYSQSLAKLGYVAGVGAAPIDAPRANLTGDPYITDGLRVVLWVASQPTDIGDIEDLDWGSRPVR